MVIIKSSKDGEKGRNILLPYKVVVGLVTAIDYGGKE